LLQIGSVAVPRLCQEIEDDTAAAAAAGDVLAHLGGEVAGPAVLQRYLDATGKVKAAYGEALLHAGVIDARAMAVYLEAFAGDVERARERASATLNAIGPPAAAALIPLLRGNAVDRCLDLLRQMGPNGLPAREEVLRVFSGSPGPRAAAAARALLAFGPDALPLPAGVIAHGLNPSDADLRPQALAAAVASGSDALALLAAALPWLDEAVSLLKRHASRAETEVLRDLKTLHEKGRAGSARAIEVLLCMGPAADELLLDMLVAQQRWQHPKTPPLPHEVSMRLSRAMQDEAGRDWLLAKLATVLPAPSAVYTARLLGVQGSLMNMLAASLCDQTTLDKLVAFRNESIPVLRELAQAGDRSIRKLAIRGLRTLAATYWGRVLRLAILGGRAWSDFLHQPPITILLVIVLGPVLALPALCVLTWRRPNVVIWTVLDRRDERRIAGRARIPPPRSAPIPVDGGGGRRGRSWSHPRCRHERGGLGGLSQIRSLSLARGNT
jgi:hypothetical protein